MTAAGLVAKMGAMFVRQVTAAELVCFMLLVLVGWLPECGCAPGRQEETGKQGARKVLVVGLESNPTNLDPRLATDVASARVTQVVFNSLLRKDVNSRLVPELATSWQARGDREYLFYLRRGVKFHDGSELTARDVEYTFSSILDENFNSPRRSSYEQIERIEVLDDYTIRFVLKKPFAPFLLNMTMGIVPRRRGKEPDFARRPIGSGPFKLLSWRADEELVFARHEGYFEGPPPLDGLVYKIIPEDTTRLLALQKGDLDLVQNAVAPDMLARLKQEPRLRVLTRPGTTYAYLGFNLRDKILGRRLVRQAIALSIDRSAIIEHILGGLAAPARSLLPPGNWAYCSELPDYEYDPPRARRLLDEAGFPDPDGQGPAPRFSLRYKTSQNELSRRIAEVLQEQLKAVGIGLQIKSYEWGSFFADISKGNFQLYSLKWVGVSDPDIYYYIFHSKNVPPRGANRGHYLNPELDRLLEQGREVLEENARAGIYRKVQQILARDLPYVSLWHTMNVVVINRRVRGFVLYPAGDFTSLKQVYLRD